MGQSGTAEGRPLHIVQFTRSFHFGGTEVQVLELLRGLPDGFRVRVGVLEATGPLLESVWEVGHVPESFPLKGTLAHTNSALQVLRLARWLRRHRCELVHVHDFYSTVLAVPAAKLAGCRVLVGRLDLSHWQGPARRAVHAELTRRADHVVCNADAIRQMLLAEEDIAPARVSVIPNGLDLARFDARMRDGLVAPLPDTAGAPVVVHVANMNHPVKRQGDLLDALRTVRARGVNLHAFLVGDGPLRPAFEQRARELGIRDAAHFLGHRPDVPAIYARASLGVLCSSAEGLSNAVMEGMAARLPMVVTRVGGNTDLVADGERGRVVEPQQPRVLARAMLEVLSNPRVAQRMGRAARRFVETELSLERMVERHASLYRRIATRSAPTAS
ncbi:MAG: glycosyltransferase [Myxococcaceae bacterium]|nr:glycosyltransferase [Myxococcaceae bacterium]MCI0670659.1 glycosyltransferase [Myxococcaceae bacterium]